MKPSRPARKPDSGEEERELVLDTDAEAQARAPEGDLVIQMGAEADGETEAEDSTPAPEPQDIPVQDLLTDLVGVSRRLGVAPRARTEPASDETPDANAQPAPDVAPDATVEPDEDNEAPEPDGPGDPQAERPSLTGYRRYALHGLLLSLALAAAVAGLMGAERLARTEPAQRSPIVVATVPGIAPGLDGQPETTAEPTPEPPPILTPEPTPELQPAYFLYTVQPGDTVSDIAAVFAISPAYILWNNPDVIYDPNLVLVGEQLLIPSVDGIIYHVKPRDTLPDIAALYQIDVESILTFAPNGLTSSDGVIEGMILILPGAVPPLLPRPPAVVEPTASEPQPTEPTPAPEAPTASEPQAMEPAPTPEAPTPSEPQPTEPTPTAEESLPFSIGHTYP
jgi:LysM repeat protein